MKKILVLALLSSVVSTGAFAAACDGGGSAQAAGAAAGGTAGTEQCVCNGGVALKSTVNGGSGTVVTTPVFIKAGFDVQCSSSTLVSYNEISGTQFVVAGGSIKGNQTVKGSSNGGSVVVHAKCDGTNGACTPGNVTTALTAASSL